jgi:hypothetical protein
VQPVEKESTMAVNAGSLLSGKNAVEMVYLYNIGLNAIGARTPGYCPGQS